MKKLEIKNIQINFNQAEDALTIPMESRHDNMCGSATQSGRSMIEMLGVLAIIGVLSVGGIAGYSKAMTKYRINKTIEQITLIAGNVRTFFAPQRNYDGLNNHDVIKKAKLVPEEMWNGNEIKNVFGGDVKILYDSGYKAFNIKLLDIPAESCIELLSQNWTDEMKGILISENIDSDVGSDSSNVYHNCDGTSTGLIDRINGLPPYYSKPALLCGKSDITIENAVNACGNSNRQIQFTFK